jgi:hypothetical protein
MLIRQRRDRPSPRDDGCGNRVEAELAMGSLIIGHRINRSTG